MQLDTFALMEDCLRATGQPRAENDQVLVWALGHPAWEVQYAAAVAVGDRQLGAAVPALLDLLVREDAAPLYTQTGDLASAPAGSNGPLQAVFPPGTDAATIEAWRRRGRVKQAVCFALGAIGHPAADAALAVLHRYAVDQREDYAVRAAACRALGLIGSPASGEVLAQACADGEFCTATEARKALNRTSGKS